MISGSVRGVAKSITIVAREAHSTVGSTPADLMSRATPAAHVQDEYPTATAPAAHRSGLDGGVHTRLLDRPFTPPAIESACRAGARPAQLRDSTSGRAPGH